MNSKKLSISKASFLKFIKYSTKKWNVQIKLRLSCSFKMNRLSIVKNRDLTYKGCYRQALITPWLYLGQTQ